MSRPRCAYGRPGIVTLIAMIVYIASFAFSLGPVVWTLISEIFPNRIRGKAMAVATAFNRAFCFIVGATFLSIINAIGSPAAFALFAVLCIVAFFWVRAKAPETKGKSLEQIQEAWASMTRSARSPRSPSTQPTDKQASALPGSGQRGGSCCRRRNGQRWAGGQARNARGQP